MLDYFMEMLLIEEENLGRCEHCLGECMDPLFCIELFVCNETPLNNYISLHEETMEEDTK